ncbi:uncharacterized protein LOC127136175 [Lathyrus oleraceus]|uniref:uncharacterized protein LOC127136175 n=1 Tax=Pisum sativum TaxID=3888 RepID=UPI0021D0C51A|nr:uncharacterized protein LOC127136175 [Pisum sativum]
MAVVVVLSCDGGGGGWTESRSGFGEGDSGLVLAVEGGLLGGACWRKKEARFEELVKLFPHYNGAVIEASKCIKFENGLHPEIKRDIGYQQTCQLPELVSKGKKPSGGGTLTPIKCYKCGGAGHHANECKSDEKKCFNYGKLGNLISDCKTNVPTCYNCGEPGHINTNCQNPKKAQSRGKVFALAGSQTTSSDRLVRGISYIHNIPLIVIIDTVSTLSSGLIIDTPTNGSVNTYLIFLNCPLSIYGRDFGVDLIFLPLSDLDVILEMNWLELNYIHINYYNKLIFHQKEMDFVIDLVLGTIHVSMEPYIISSSELGELKIHLGALLENKFIKPSVSPWGAQVLLVKKNDGSIRLCVDYR